MRIQTIVLSVIAAAAIFTGVILVARNHKVSLPDSASQPTNTVNGLRYLPLGDSYTIGESVATDQRWPNQLVRRLTQSGTSVSIVANPAITGYTSQDLIDKELPLVAKLKPDFVTVQIGVNDYVQGVPTDQYEKHLIYILNTLQKEMAQPNHILLVTIPDYGKTPTGSRYGTPSASEAGIKVINAIIATQAKQRNLPVADIFNESQKVTSDADLIAPDGLHPSSKQYSEWTDIIYPLSKNLLTNASL